MNIRFDVPALAETGPVQPRQLSKGVRNFHKTEYRSSLRVIHLIQPKDIVFVNMPGQGAGGRLLSTYQADFGQFGGQSKISAFNSSEKKECYFSYSNELLEYKMNYLPEMQQKKVQRVRGTIVKEGSLVQIHLDCLDDAEISHFRLEKFYGLVQAKMRCTFTGLGIEVEGVKIYRKDNLIVMEGDYSEEYFQVRRELYKFLGLS